jgi:methyltransferase
MIAGLVIAVFATMLLEAAISRRHDARLRARGAVEPPADVYAAMLVAYPGVFILVLAEGVWRGVILDGVAVAGLAVFAVAKALKYWAIASLGERWTFRVLVPPGSTRTRRGPYRWLPHPNYLAVAGEIVGCAVASHALVTGPIAFAAFGTLILQRIKVEEAALGEGTISST